jgi:hypothetical protein
MADAKSRKKPKTTQPDKERQAVNEHLALLTKFETRRSNKEDIWERIADLVQPFLEDIEQTAEPDEQYGLKMFDGTAPRALEIATNGTYSNVISQTDVWFRPVPQLNDLNEIAEVRAYLQDVTEQLLFALNRSNFYRESLTLIANGIGMGTGTMLIEDRDGTGVCNTIHPGQIFIDEDEHGIVDTIYRKYKVEIRHLADKFGIDKLSRKQKKLLDDNPVAPVNMLHTIFKRRDYNPFKLDNLNMPVASVWIDIDERKIMGESGFDSFPGVVWRYFKNSGEIYGRGPAELVLPTIEGSNQLSEDMLYVSEVTAMPPVQAPTDMRGKVKIGPREINYLSNNEQIGAIDLGNNYPVGAAEREELRTIIREAFNVDFFLLIASGAAQQRTAFEVSEIQSEKALIVAPTIARLTKEVLDPALERFFDIEEKAGRMPEPPPILEDLGENGQLDIEYQGPLAQIQARLFQNRGIVNGLQTMIPVFEIEPSAKDNIDFDEITRDIAKANNWPEKAIKSREKTAEIRTGRDQDAQDAAQLAKAGAGAKALKDAASANADLGGELTDQITEAVTGGQEG